MANLTISVDPEILRRARIRALERGESVNSYLADKAGIGSPQGGHARNRGGLHRA